LEPDTVGRMARRPVPLGELTYTVVDLETTGLKPLGNGITEVCCLRVRDGRITDRLSTLVNPGRPIPPFIQSMTGISDDMVRNAPTFGQVIPALLEFLGDSVLVAHNAPFDLSFINYGLHCHGRRALHNPVVDTRRLARRLLQDLPRASLEAVTAYLGIQVEHRHRAEGDAEATAELLLRLLSLCRQRGVESDTQLMQLLASDGRGADGRPKAEGRALPRGAVALAERVRSLPEAPGVYIMRSAAGQVLYVGKAVSLRRRLASYFQGRLPARTRRLMEQVESIEHHLMGSELEALLEESRLIKLHQPPFNVLQRDYQDFPFIKVDESGPFPRLAVTRELHYDGASYFGPFRGVRETEQAVEILSRCFRLYDGRCPTRPSGESCLYLQMDRCLGPCLDPGRAERHRGMVEEVRRLLETRPGELEAELRRRRDAAAERLDFETAILYRDGMEALTNALVRRRLLAPAIRDLNVLAVCPSVYPGWAELFAFAHGRLVERGRLQVGDREADRVAALGFLRLLASRWAQVGDEVDARIDAEKLDQVNIISRWLERQGEAAGVITLEPGWPADGMAALAERLVEAIRQAAGGTAPMEVDPGLP